MAAKGSGRRRLAAAAMIDSRLRVELNASYRSPKLQSKCLLILRRRSVPRHRLSSSRLNLLSAQSAATAAASASVRSSSALRLAPHAAGLTMG